ncbi:MAG: hypothetical protein AMJ79_08775 [Phycisphaerae bacterium SM23_30]|nr:MAG: hypothetical protein AMJ79_08775 [Phycisphaerae bacterium SM23_30]
MITGKKDVIAMIVVLTSTLSAGIAQPQETTERELKFKVSTVPFSETENRTVLHDTREPRPGSYVAEVIIIHDKNPYLDGWYNLVPKSELYKTRSMSIQQQGIIRITLEADPMNRPSYFPGWPIGSSSDPFKKYYLPGWTEDDARKMAQALLEVLDKENAGRLEKARQELKQRKERAAQQEKSIAELRLKKKPIEEQLESFKNTIYYQTIEDARRSIFEWSNLINVIEVDIVGIRAKLEMIEQQRDENQKRKKPLESITNALFQIEMANKIELAGALARKGAAQVSLEKAKEFVHLCEQEKELAAPLKSYEQSLAEEEAAIDKLEKTLADLPPYMRPIEVLDNTVTIYPYKKEI